MTANTTQRGYLLLADISGYTSFIAATELEHAQDILSELLELIIGQFKTWLTIHKLEGDAVFAYAPESKIQRGESLFELIETTYIAFRARRDAVHRRTTCTCNACRNIPNLDLKFITHYGDYFVQDIMGTKELVGSDVNLVHRLLKNHITETTGGRAYALFTEQSLAHLNFHPEGLHEQIESYEHLGDVCTLSMDLHARYKELMDAHRVCISPDQADVTLDYDFAASPNVLWDWFHEPRKRDRWMTAEIVPIKNMRGRSGPGARNHCIHGKNSIVVEDVLDMQPFDYFTVRHTPLGAAASLLITFRFKPNPDHGTHVCVTFIAEVPKFMQWLAKQFCRMIVHVEVLRRWKFEKLDGLIASWDSR
jgi:uncharacterized protein YndB with AHSA1/START domain